MIYQEFFFAFFYRHLIPGNNFLKVKHKQLEPGLKKAVLAFLKKPNLLPSKPGFERKFCL